MNDNEIIEKALEILEGRILNTVITSPEDCANFLKLKLADLEHEVFCVIYLNTKHAVIKYEEMFRGTLDGTTVHPREVAKSALMNNAAALIFAHNHPSMVAEPSQADIQITRRLCDALALLDIRVLDHLIIAGPNHASLAELGRI